jgi:hypothetical protein
MVESNELRRGLVGSRVGLMTDSRRQASICHAGILQYDRCFLAQMADARWMGVQTRGQVWKHRDVWQISVLRQASSVRADVNRMESASED